VSVLRLGENLGIAGALNHGLQQLLGQEYAYIARVDAGDTVEAARFEKQIRFLEANALCAAVSSFVDFLAADRTPLFRYRAPCDHPDILRKLHLNNCLVHSGALMRGSALREVGLYREDVPGAEDYELFLRLAQRYRLAVLPEVLTFCEYSEKGLSVTGRRRQQRERLKLQLRYFDVASPYSYWGVARTLVAMLIPHTVVFHFKVAFAK
jgi:GT2 family glycosyltransferase